MVRGILFDLDGVLLESTEVKTRAFRELFAEYPHQLKEILAYHENHAGVSRFEKFRHIVSRILREQLSDERFAFLCNRYSELVLVKVLSVPLVAGVQEFLQDYHRKALLFVASGTPQDEVGYVLEQRGLGSYFQGAFGSPSSKTEIVKTILSKWSLSSDQVVLVGDSDTDLQAAENSGVRFIGRIHSNSPASWSARSDLVTVRDLFELRTRIEVLPCPA